jgi:hypothetical protein
LSGLSAAALVFLICIAGGKFIERSMAAHMLVLLPGLAFAGWLVGGFAMQTFPRLAVTDWNVQGATGLVVAISATGFWMLPRSLDWSLGDPGGEFAKYAMLPLLVGLPLALSWPRTGPTLRHFIKANTISMALTTGWLYSVAPVRLCNSYAAGTTRLLVAGIGKRIIISLVRTVASLAHGGPVRLGNATRSKARTSHIVGDYRCRVLAAGFWLYRDFTLGISMNDHPAKSG